MFDAGSPFEPPKLQRAEGTLHVAFRSRDGTTLLETLHQAGATLLVITHNPAVAARAQRRVTIRDGQLEEQVDDPAFAGRNGDRDAGAES